MLLLLTITAFFVALTLGAVFTVLRKIRVDEEVPAEVLSQDCPSARYRPMLRLLDELDCEFVAAGFPGDKRQMRKFRTERRSLFRVYLRNLGSDHARIVAAIRKMMVDSQMDRPELVKALYRCQVMFLFAMLSVECKLFFHTLGIGAVDARSLVSAVEALQLQLQDMVFVQAVG